MRGRAAHDPRLRPGFCTTISVVGSEVITGMVLDVGSQGAAVGRQTAVIKQEVEAAEIITFACDRLSLVISPKLTICCPDGKTETLL